MKISAEVFHARCRLIYDRLVVAQGAGFMNRASTVHISALDGGRRRWVSRRRGG